MNFKTNILLLGVGVALAGCAKAPEGEIPDPLPPGKQVDFKPNAIAGVPIESSKDDTKFKTLVASVGRSFGSRQDPFVLLAAEKAYDRAQTGERLFSQVGFSTEYVPPVEKDDTPILEQQPYRRLAGVVVGTDGVIAIIDMGSGQGTQLIRPGQRIPNSQWTVVSIDEDKAVLRRSGNVEPKEIIVKLEQAPANFGTGFGGGYSGGPSGMPGGAPYGSPSGSGGPGRGMAE